VNEIRRPGPLLKLACEHLLKMLLLLDSVSVTQGDEQVIKFSTTLGTAVFRVQVERERPEIAVRAAAGASDG
jgi:hypothetical protein